MPQLITDSDVKEILKTRIDTQPFIETAVVLVDVHLATAGYTTLQLREIQRYLAAHLACARDPRLLEQRTDQLSATFQRTKQGKGLDSTDYGPTVRMLDTSGLLEQALTQEGAVKYASIRVD